ncbi:3061_t:CDS:2, partial [Scutellospora calospora]
MSQHHIGGSERHRFTTDIIVLGTKPTNKYNTYCVCKACDEKLSWEETLKNLITNKKNIIRNHLKNCEHFRAKRGSEETVRSYLDDMNDETSSISSIPLMPKKLRKKASKSNIMSNFIVKDVATTNQATQKFFKFLNPALTLPTRRALLNRILDAEWNNFIKSREQKLEGDGIGVTLAFDGWKNILKQNIFGSLFILSNGEVQVWEVIDISSERERMIDIIPKIEKMISDTSIIGAKLLAIVSDSVPAYTATRRRLRLQYSEIVLSLASLINNEKVLAMCQIRASINFSQRKQQVHTYNTMYNQSSASLIGKTIDVQNEFEADLDEEHNELYNIELSNLEDWKNQLCDWEQMLTDEEVARLEGEKEERDNHDNMESDLLSNYKHPAVDDNAKWKLESLFS